MDNITDQLPSKCKTIKLIGGFNLALAGAYRIWYLHGELRNL